MRLCRVTGTAEASRKDESFRTSKLLVVQPVDLQGGLAPESDMLAVDPGFGAGTGDLVLVAREGGVTREVTGQPSIPANVVVLAVVDDWSIGTET